MRFKSIPARSVRRDKGSDVGVVIDVRYEDAWLGGGDRCGSSEIKSLKSARWSLRCSKDCQGRSALHLMANSVTTINSFAMVFMLDNQFDVQDSLSYFFP